MTYAAEKRRERARRGEHMRKERGGEREEYRRG
jgi:hypothetical protein